MMVLGLPTTLECFEAFPGTQPKLARSWRLLLEEVFLIYERDTFDLKEGRSTTCDGFRLSTNQRWWFKVFHQPEGMLMGIHVSGYISESGMTNCGSGSLELLATTLNMEWEILSQARLICRRSLYMTTIFPPVRDKVRWWRKLNCKCA